MGQNRISGWVSGRKVVVSRRVPVSAQRGQGPQAVRVVRPPGDARGVCMRELHENTVEETLVSDEDQALFEAAGFIDSGWQCFEEQTRSLDDAERVKAAFYAGAGLALMSAAQFRAIVKDYGPNAEVHLTNLLIDEVNEYMGARGIKLIWTPHIPRKMKQ